MPIYPILLHVPSSIGNGHLISRARSMGRARLRADLTSAVISVCTCRPRSIFYGIILIMPIGQSVTTMYNNYDYPSDWFPLLASGASDAHEQCFIQLNDNGDRFGNCGHNTTNFLPCSTRYIIIHTYAFSAHASTYACMTHACSHAHTHARTHARTHASTHTLSDTLTAHMWAHGSITSFSNTLCGQLQCAADLNNFINHFNLAVQIVTTSVRIPSGPFTSCT